MASDDASQHSAAAAAAASAPSPDASPKPAPGERPAPQVALVTGGSRGIGLAVVEALLSGGWRVFFCSRSADSVSRAETDLRARFGAASVTGRAVDVRRQAQVASFVEESLAAAGRVDCLVNNAGLGRFAAVDALSAEQWQEVIETNLSGPFYCIQAVAPAMRRQGGGWIFNIGSLAGRNAMAGGAAYNASKFGLIGLSEAAMLDLRQAGIKVAAILPGSVDTGFGDSARRDDRSWMLAPQDVAAMVLHLLSYPERALPSLVEMRPTRPPRR